MSIDGVLFISCFLPVVLALHWLIPGDRGRNALLLAASLVFYAFGSLTGLLLLLVVAAVNYIIGLLIMAGKARKLLCGMAVVLDLAFLGTFKYLNFLLSEVLGLPAVELGIAAPLGISFFVFKCISYLVDTFRDSTAGSRSFPAFLLYISFFPQITAGPIARFPQFARQLAGRQRDPRRIAQGLRRFVAGMGKKLVLASALAKIADGVFSLEASALDIRLAWLGAGAYMLQIYFDFSGYSDMAIGLGGAFGFETPENFNYPYTACSITDFWRRWHISLSSWFRDYLYIPLGGNRKGKLRTALNKAAVFLCCGIWHGSAWTFLLWGVWHGVFSALESAKAIRPKGGVLSRIYTLLVVCLGFVMFRAETVGQGLAVIGAMFTGFSMTEAGTVLLRSLLSGQAVWALAVGAVLCAPVMPWLKKLPGAEKWLEPLSYAGTVALFVLCVMQLASGGFAPFIYAQF